MAKNHGYFVITGTALTQMYTSQGTYTEIRQEYDERNNILEKTIKKSET